MTRTKAETSMTVRKDTSVSNPRSAHACFDSIRTSKDKRRESQSDESRARLSCALSRYQVPRPAAAAAADSTTGEELVRRTAARGFSPNKTTPAQSTPPLLQQYIVIKLAQMHTGDLASSLKRHSQCRISFIHTLRPQCIRDRHFWWRELWCWWQSYSLKFTSHIMNFMLQSPNVPWPEISLVMGLEQYDGVRPIANGRKHPPTSQNTTLVGLFVLTSLKCLKCLKSIFVSDTVQILKWHSLSAEDNDQG